MTEAMAWKRLAERGERPADDKRATELLLALYEPLAMRAARTVQGRRTEDLGTDDGVAIALLALSDAIRVFDPSLGVRFGSYAHSFIRYRVQNAVKDAAPIPRHEQQARASLHLGKPLPAATTANGAARAAAPPLRFARLSEVFPLTNGTAPPVDGFASVGISPPVLFTDPAVLLQRTEQMRRVAEAVERLPPSLRDILTAYFLDAETLKDMGARMGISSTGICKRRDKALFRLRRVLTDESGAFGAWL